MDRLIVTSEIIIAESEIEEKFICSSGPGGQNVNKVATAVQLRFDIQNSSLPDRVKHRLTNLEGGRITGDGVLLIDARQFRTQEQNRQDARQRLIELIRKAAEIPKQRRPTKATRASRLRRMVNKIRRGNLKRLRRGKPDESD
ncbi:MAG: alternative ribosome rescue aminoacyl-tRNA hydrolase ArfB [Desulfatirhabdiaceae bacterium]